LEDAHDDRTEEGRRRVKPPPQNLAELGFRFGFELEAEFSRWLESLTQWEFREYFEESFGDHSGDESEPELETCLLNTGSKKCRTIVDQDHETS
jgi:hypothetical protein